MSIWFTDEEAGIHKSTPASDEESPNLISEIQKFIERFAKNWLNYFNADPVGWPAIMADPLETDDDHSDEEAAT